MKSISKLKKELDKWFSLYIRLRSSNEYGITQCYTCSKAAHYKTGGMQCGHFQSRSYLATRFDEVNCQVQCVGCNMFKQGEQYKFALALDANYGEGTADELLYLAKTTIKISRADYEEKISYYKEVVNKLKKEKGLE
jgi:hypothetical protein|tara:strand:+ start:222 stop:632 length:411 start_codon:yes stop_codon:yes gene_type:complete